MKISSKDLISFENNRRMLYIDTADRVGDFNHPNMCNMQAAVNVLISKGILPADFVLEWTK